MSPTTYKKFSESRTASDVDGAVSMIQLSQTHTLFQPIAFQYRIYYYIL